MANHIEYDAVRNHAEELVPFGKCALIVTGAHSAKANGSLDDVISVLEKNSVSYRIFDRVEENPSIETVMEARDEGISCGADFVIGIGGGSPMDAAKAIAVMIKNSGETWELLYKDEQAGGIPVVCVPTTCGTGSEVTAVAVLTRHDKKTKITAKQKLFPALSLVDPGYLKDTPLSVIRNTSIDAMGHMIESYINTKASEESREHALSGLKIWSEVKGYLIDGIPQNPEKKAEVLMKLMQASNHGGYAIVTPGTSLPHGMSYELTYRKHVPHGIAIGIFQPGYLSFAEEASGKKLLETMGFADMDEFRDFIKVCCTDPMFAKYLTREEYLEIVAGTSERFLTDTSRLEKIPYHMDQKVLAGITDMVLF